MPKGLLVISAHWGKNHSGGNPNLQLGQRMSRMLAYDFHKHLQGTSTSLREASGLAQAIVRLPVSGDSARQVQPAQWEVGEGRGSGRGEEAAGGTGPERRVGTRSNTLAGS